MRRYLSEKGLIMFGYVLINPEGLTKEEQSRYRQIYCGVCQDLYAATGARGRLTLTYDAAFLALVLNALYEPEEAGERFVCGPHPLRRRYASRGSMTAYAADINLILSYYSCLDGWKDDNSLIKKKAASMLKPAFEAASARVPEKAAVIQTELEALSRLEEARTTDIDAAAGCFGRLLGSVFAVEHDIWAASLNKMGDALGRFIYILDAWRDLKSDRRKGSFNPLLSIQDEKDYEDRVYAMLKTEMALCAQAFETLPIVKDIHLIRNVLYSGVWTRYSRKHPAASGEETL